MTEYEALQAAYETAKQADKASPSDENKRAVIAAWNALSAAAPKLKTWKSRGNLAGKRQLAERLAQAQENMLRAAIRK